MSKATLTRTALKDLGIDPARRPEGTTKEFQKRVQRDMGGRRWLWSPASLQAEHRVSTWLISLN